MKLTPCSFLVTLKHIQIKCSVRRQQQSDCKSGLAEHEGITLNQKTITACGRHQQLPLTVHTYYPLHFNIDRCYKTLLPSLSNFQALILRDKALRSVCLQFNVRLCVFVPPFVAPTTKITPPSLSVPLLSLPLCHPFFHISIHLSSSPSHHRSKSESVFTQSRFSRVSPSRDGVLDERQAVAHARHSGRGLYLERAFAV